VLKETTRSHEEIVSRCFITIGLRRYRKVLPISIHAFSDAIVSHRRSTRRDLHTSG